AGAARTDARRTCGRIRLSRPLAFPRRRRAPAGRRRIVMEIRDTDLLDELPEGEEAPPPGTRIAAAVRWGLLALVLLAAAGTTAMALGWLGTGARAAAVYHCPMHPTVVSDRAGDCPICGMDLVPVREGETATTHVHGHDEDEEVRR